MEIWRDIKNYEGLYQVSTIGNVKSIDRYVDNRVSFRKGKEIKKILQYDGYITVSLHKDGKSKQFMVHRLVAEAFIDNPENLPFVNHIDGHKANNCVENLEWCTASQNVRHAIRTGLVSHESLVEKSRKGADKVSVHLLCVDSGEVFYTIYESKQRLNYENIPKMKNIDQFSTHGRKGFHIRKIDDDEYKEAKQHQKSKYEYDRIYEGVWRKCKHGGRSVPVYCVEQDVVYRSVNQAAKENNMDNATIDLAIKENRSCKGLTFRRVEGDE